MNPLEEHALNLIKKARQNKRIRQTLAIALVCILLLLAGKFILELIPRHYVLSITGGSVLSQRHFLIKLLQDEVKEEHISLKIVKTGGSLEALEMVDEGQIDLALVQGGLEAKFPNVMHVATLSPELIHFLVKPGINNLKDLRGSVINMGEPEEGTRILARQILAHSNLVENVDYAEKNFSDEELIGMHAESLPDVVVEVSYAPSDLADFLVKKRGYHLLEMSFPPSLAKRLGWVSDAKILGYMYSIMPPVPPMDIQVVGVNLHLVANKNVDPKAVAALLKTLYGHRIGSRFGNPIVEANILIPSGYQVSKGTELYLASKQPLITSQMIDQIKGIFGLIMTLLSIALIVFKWFKEPGEGDEDDDVDSKRSKTLGIGDHMSDLSSNMSKLE